MCGIAGIFHAETPKPVDPARVERMCDALAHRGPDGAGVWTDHGVGLGHRRLSIIDVAGSPQPMHSADGRAVIVFNGEIYNFRELRSELEQAGFTFRTSGDTEVILAAWQRWGPDCLARLDGMFAFALYDRDKRQLFLARDRFGVKPLFYAPLSDGSIAFASELKGLLAHPLLRRRVNPQAIEAYMTWGYVPDSHSILAGVEKLPAGHFLLLQQGRAPGRPQRWWDIDFTGRERGSEADLSAQLVHLLREAVRSRMVADVPLGAFLSGGVDSSGVVALMSEASAAQVQTCSIGFDVAAYDETSYARQVAAKFGADHQERIVATDDFGAIDSLAAMFDEPFADASALPTWRVCQLARERVTVALSGDGADEAFGGYRRQVFHHHEERARSVLP
ncbi:MAG: asparagine synthase (glutamine-hydrolyzing), partial [Erythrobacter sp.]|nr:asparagine synthase (glutamine-hydrolyzing) [Erythrobacter sp.]